MKTPRAVTRIDVAREAGVAPSTVTRALNNHPKIPDATRKRIRALAGKLGYIPSRLVRSYYQNRSFHLGVVVPIERGRERHPMPYEYFSKTLFGITQGAQQAGYGVTIVQDPGLSKEDLAQPVLTRAVDGFVVLAAIRGDRRFAYLDRRGIPFVFVHHYVRNRPYVYVDCDSRTGMEEAFAHVAAGRVGTVSFLGGGDGYVDSVDRKRIFLELSHAHGFRVKCLLDGDYSRRSGHSAAARFLADGRTDVVFCANDRMAYGLLEALAERGVAVPRDVRVIGFDNLEIAAMASPPLTTIENPFHDIGRTAARLLIAAIRAEAPASERLATRLVVREST